MKKLSDEQKKELERLKDWALTILKYIEKNMANNDRFMPILINLIDTVHKVYEEENSRGMKLMVQDFTSWGKSLNKEEVHELNQILKNKFGEDLNYNRKKIEKIISKGVIEKLSEYELLFDYFEEIYADESKEDEASKVNSLLEAYQTKTGKV